jgi:SWIM zinc finger
MSPQELDQRARARSTGVKTWKAAGQPLYLVRSLTTDPGAMHTVQVTVDGEIAECSCKGWEYRRSCIHAQAVLKRLEREGIRKSADVEPIMYSRSTKHQVFREEA